MPRARFRPAPPVTARRPGQSGAGYPALRAQHSVYTVKQLQDYLTQNRYRDATDANTVHATRNSAMMATIAARLTPEDIRNLASVPAGNALTTGPERRLDDTRYPPRLCARRGCGRRHVFTCAPATRIARQPRRHLDGRVEGGTNYTLLARPQPTNVEPGKVEVVEVFWYGCSHCYALDPVLESWKKNKAAYIEFVRVPVIWGPCHARTRGCTTRCRRSAAATCTRRCSTRSTATATCSRRHRRQSARAAPRLPQGARRDGEADSTRRTTLLDSAELVQRAQTLTDRYRSRERAAHDRERQVHDQCVAGRRDRCSCSPSSTISPRSEKRR